MGAADFHYGQHAASGGRFDLLHHRQCHFLILKFIFVLHRFIIFSLSAARLQLAYLPYYIERFGGLIFSDMLYGVSGVDEHIVTDRDIAEKRQADLLGHSSKLHGSFLIIDLYYLGRYGKTHISAPPLCDCGLSQADSPVIGRNAAVNKHDKALL